MYKIVYATAPEVIIEDETQATVLYTTANGQAEMFVMVDDEWVPYP